ncbi:hypothetical protein [Sorangium sp. So ce124]|uniref:hypothetical protein n=1 Tax=Sorangium sp. So ce124 TaxID=3133280 RepID=UPI003F6297C1
MLASHHVTVFDPFLVRLDVVRDAELHRGTWWTLHEEDGVVLVRATTTPDDQETWAQIQWTGGAPVTGNPNLRAVPRAVFDEQIIGATLGGVEDELVVRVFRLISLVLSANEASYDPAATVTATATTLPDVPDAWSQLVWHGVASSNGNTAQVSRNQLGSRGVQVSLQGKPLSDTVTVHPVLVSLVLSANQASYDTAATVTATATTSPDLPAAWDQLVWHGVASSNGNTAQVSCDQLGSRDVQVSLRGKPLSDTLTVHPVLVSLVLSANQASYDTAATVTATATTLPDLPAAWSQLQWEGATPSGDQHTAQVSCDQLGSRNVRVSLRGASRSDTLTVHPVLVSLVLGTKEASYDAAATVTATATTSPDVPDAWSQLQWEGAAPSGDQHTAQISCDQLGSRNVRVSLRGASRSDTLTVHPVLVSLVLSTKEASYDTAATVTATATTSPDVPDAWSQLQWEGAAPSGDQHTAQVSCDQLGSRNVRVSLRGASRADTLTVHPVLVRLDVANATDNGSGAWEAFKGTTDVVIRAVTSPPAAASQVTWVGGVPVQAGIVNVSCADIGTTDIEAALKGPPQKVTIIVKRNLPALLGNYGADQKILTAAERFFTHRGTEPQLGDAVRRAYQARELHSWLQLASVELQFTQGLTLLESLAPACLAANLPATAQLLKAACDVVRKGPTAVAVAQLLSRYYTLDRCVKLTELLALPLSDADWRTILADHQLWPLGRSFLVFDRMLRYAASANFGSDRALNVLHALRWVIDDFDKAMEILASAPTLPNTRLFWLLECGQRVMGDPAAAGLLIEAQGTPLGKEAAEVLVQSWGIAGQQAQDALDYATNGAGTLDVVHERLFALKSTGGNQQRANQLLAQQDYGVHDARALLQTSAGRNCAEHYANNDNSAKEAAELRRNVGANACITSGLDGMATQLARVLHQHRAEINGLQVDAETSLMKYTTHRAGKLWISIQGGNPVKEDWVGLEVVLIRRSNGTLFVKHCQPTTAKSWA